MAQAQRPPSSTAAGAQERAAAADEDAAEFVKNLFIVDEDTADASEVSTLPQLQRLLENMDAQAGRVMPNKTYCLSGPLTRRIPRNAARQALMHRRATRYLRETMRCPTWDRTS